MHDIGNRLNCIDPESDYKVNFTSCVFFIMVYKRVLVQDSGIDRSGRILEHQEVIIFCQWGCKAILTSEHHREIQVERFPPSARPLRGWCCWRWGGAGDRGRGGKPLPCVLDTGLGTGTWEIVDTLTSICFHHEKVTIFAQSFGDEHR